MLKQDLNDYEEKRIPRRTGLNLRMGGLDRRRILLRLGVEEADILAAAQNAHKVRVQRQQSVGPWRLSILKLEKKDPKPSFFRKVANKLLSLQRSAKSSVAKN